MKKFLSLICVFVLSIDFVYDEVTLRAVSASITYGPNLNTIETWMNSPRDGGAVLKCTANWTKHGFLQREVVSTIS